MNAEELGKKIKELKEARRRLWAETNKLSSEIYDLETKLRELKSKTRKEYGAIYYELLCQRFGQDAVDAVKKETDNKYNAQ